MLPFFLREYAPTLVLAFKMLSIFLGVVVVVTVRAPMGLYARTPR